MSSNHSPKKLLNIWLWSFSLFLTVNAIAYICLAYYLPSSYYQLDQVNLERLREIEEIRRKYPSDKIIVIVGSSKVQFGFYCPEYYQRNIIKADSNRIHIVKIHEGGFRLDHFINDLGLLDALAKSRPDELLIESDLILLEPKQESPLDRHYSRYINRLRHAKNKILSKNTTTLTCDNPYYHNFSDSLNIEITPRQLNSYTNISGYLEKLVVLQQEQVKVSLIKMPYPEQVNVLIDKYIDKNEQKNLLEKIRKDYHVDCLEMDNQMPWSAFVDHGHMNQIGRDRFNQWLISHIRTTHRSK